MERCEHCGAKQKRFRPAFGSWICNKCKIETKSKRPDVTSLSEAYHWWVSLSSEDKIKIWNENK